MKKSLQIVLMAGVAMGIAQSADASAITFVGTQGGLVAAVRVTDIGSGVLRVELGNFGQAASVPADVLTGVFFDGTAPLTGLTPLTAFTSATSTIVGNPTTGCVPDPPGSPCPSGANLNVGGEWSGQPSPLSPYEYGISSSGVVGSFGSGNFNGLNLSDPNSVNGLNFGLVSIPFGVDPGANTGVTKEALVRGVVTFTLQGPVGFDPAIGITGVRFQYGTALTEPNFTGNPLPPGVPTPFDVQAVPEPGSMLLLGTGLLLAGRMLRRRLS